MKKLFNDEAENRLKKNAQDIFEKTKNKLNEIADQNDDGKFDISDLSLVAEKVSESVKAGTDALKGNAEERARLLEIKTLQPIFTDSLNDEHFFMSKFIRIAPRDKKRATSEVCSGSIGFFSDQKELHIVNIFRDSIASFNLEFYPDSSSDFYYVDPINRNRYIALDDYFSYLKVERINELQRLAQSLGAKHFRVTYKEEQNSSNSRKVKASVNAKKAGGTNAEHDSLKTNFETIEIAAEMDCPGHLPTKPHLCYLQNDSSIKNLISMRFDEHSPLNHQKYMLKLSNSSGLKESDAIKIDTFIKGIKTGINTSIVNEAKNEAKRYFEYEINF